MAVLPAHWQCPQRITPRWLAAQPLILNDASTHLSRLTAEWFAPAGRPLRRAYSLTTTMPSKAWWLPDMAHPGCRTKRLPRYPTQELSCGRHDPRCGVNSASHIARAISSFTRHVLTYCAVCARIKRREKPMSVQLPTQSWSERKADERREFAAGNIAEDDCFMERLFPDALLTPPSAFSRNLYCPSRSAHRLRRTSPGDAAYRSASYCAQQGSTRISTTQSSKQRTRRTLRVHR